MPRTMVALVLIFCGWEGGISEMMGVGSGEDLAGSVECCMCGDHGLTKELFQCRSCHSRYQHK